MISSASAQILTLPTYHLRISDAHLDSLKDDPFNDATYPAFLTYDGENYQVRLRFRGTTGRNQPKKSWKIFFDNDYPGDFSEINLNAEYRDKSYSRNYLSMELARFSGLEVPATRFVSLVINDTYYGVYVEIESLDGDFFDRRDILSDALYKAVRHGARFTPMLNSEDLTLNYEPKKTFIGSLDSLNARFTFIQYGKPEEIPEVLVQWMEIDNILKNFALNLVIANRDGSTKNYYLNIDDQGIWTMYPWDADATWGNNWEGEFIGRHETLNFSGLVHNALLNRLISNPEWRERLMEIINNMASSGFDHILNTLQDAKDEISNDVYQDYMKIADNADFDADTDSLVNFIEARRVVLDNFDWFHRHDLDDSRALKSYVSSMEETVIIEAKTFEPVQWINSTLIDRTGGEFRVILRDNGESPDDLANDLVYSGEISLSGMQPPVYYGFWINSTSEEAYPCPPSGWFLFNYYPVSLPSIHLDPNPPLEGEISIGSVVLGEFSGSFLIPVTNVTDLRRNLSGCVIRLGHDHKLLRLPELETMEPGDTIWITNQSEMLDVLLFDYKLVGDFPFKPGVGDTIFLETSNGSFISSHAVEEIDNLVERVSQVVINEINYNSADSFDTGDWIEIFARSGDHDLSDWVLSDNNAAHAYSFPANLELKDGEYLVIARDTTAFAELFPEVQNVIGGVDFGFGGGGDEVRLWDSEGHLIDIVNYEDGLPWPPEPDGTGPTLELSNAIYPNFGPDYWGAVQDTNFHGTPGQRNSTWVPGPPDPFFPQPTGWQITEAYPNPFNDYIRIRYAAMERGELTIHIYNILGQRIRTLKPQAPAKGKWYTSWDGKSETGINAASGIYFIQIAAPNHSNIHKAVLIR